jgi:hypothetical protein
VHLQALIQTKADEHQAEADRLRAECDEPELSRMLEEAEFLSDADSKRWQRCHAEQRLTFLRSEQALYKALERDREAGEQRDEGPVSAGGGSGESQDRDQDQEKEAAAAECVGEAGDPLPQGEVPALGSDAQADVPAGSQCAGPHPPCGHPLPGGAGFSPSEPRIAPEPSPQMMIQREDPTQEQGAGEGVPIAVPGGAPQGHDRAPPPAAPPPLAGSGEGVVGPCRPRRARGGWVPH